MLPEVTAIFPSITLASWASIFTGKMPNETGIVGNEFFARDLIINNHAIPGMWNLPPGMVTLSDGAFKNSSSAFLFTHLLPAHELSSTTSQKLQQSSPNQSVSANAETVYEWINKQTALNNTYDVSNVQACKDGTSECRSAVFFNHYAKGADWWGTQTMGLLNYIPFSWMDYFADWVSPVILSENFDSEPRKEFINFVDGYFANLGSYKKKKRFPILTTVYFGGPDHYAHDIGLNGSAGGYTGYSDYFRRKTDAEIKTLIDKLKDLGEFDNKLFIITADHGMTEMAEFGTVTLYPGTPDERVVTPDTSCKLKVEGFNKRNIQDSEKANNNLHIWEMGEVMK